MINKAATTLAKTDVRVGDIMSQLGGIAKLIKHSDEYNEAVSDLATYLSPAANIQTLTDNRFLYDGRYVYLQGSNVPMPGLLGDRIIEFIDNKYPLDALVNFWKNCLLNPSDLSRQCLYDFIEHNGITITNTGYMVAYKGVKPAREGVKAKYNGTAGYYVDSKGFFRRSNGDLASKKEIELYNSDEEVVNTTVKYVDCHSGTFDNTPGLVVRMEREKVDHDPSQACSHGLHVGSYEYASNFGEVCLKVIVNPADVVSVPSDCSYQKIRVCQYFVSQVISEKFEGTYSDDDYAHLQTADLKAWIPFLNVEDEENDEEDYY